MVETVEAAMTRLPEQYWNVEVCWQRYRGNDNPGRARASPPYSGFDLDVTSRQALA